VLPWLPLNLYVTMSSPNGVRLRLKCDGTWLRTGGEMMGKLANGVGSQ
jgi:hypothetical protein